MKFDLNSESISAQDREDLQRLARVHMTANEELKRLSEQMRHEHERVAAAVWMTGEQPIRPAATEQLAEAAAARDLASDQLLKKILELERKATKGTLGSSQFASRVGAHSSGR